MKHSVELVGDYSSAAVFTLLFFVWGLLPILFVFIKFGALFGFITLVVSFAIIYVLGKVFSKGEYSSIKISDEIIEFKKTDSFTLKEVSFQRKLQDLKRVGSKWNLTGKVLKLEFNEGPPLLIRIEDSSKQGPVLRLKPKDPSHPLSKELDNVNKRVGILRIIKPSIYTETYVDFFKEILGRKSSSSPLKKS